MSFALYDNSLRRKLEIGIRPNEHAGIVEDVRYGEPHDVQRLANQPSLPQNGNCLSVALGIPHHGNGQFTDARFVHWLLHEDKLIELQTIEKGALVLYFDQGRWQHAGVIGKDGKVISKWGSFLYFSHPWDQVPLNYGDEMKVYRHPGSSTAAQYFKEYVEACKRLPPWAVSR